MNIRLLALLAMILICAEANCQHINDKELREDFFTKSKSIKTTKINKLKKGLSNKTTNFKINFNPDFNKPESVYEKVKKGVIVVGKVVKNGEKEFVAAASGFVISEDGLCVTNNHVLSSLNKNLPIEFTAVVVRDYDGNVYNVTKILATCEAYDIAVLKIDTKGEKLSPLALNPEYKIGSDICVLAHPNGKFYTYTKGVVTRKYISQSFKNERFGIDADFAKGSSGAPIMDMYGNVIGVVSLTRSIYFQKNQNLQMVEKECIPINSLLEMQKK